ncbi:hypothetical protein ElyMa_003542000 [Elysia marginata]|uniref:MARVEL domain-containing protein n=1 Tax=Elysia marginata TaxID=1093978 RepID=A0AAV4EKT1_9GAST|nr:hypothetical protein ElyMa_003542000 [Elysia marginata]
MFLLFSSGNQSKQTMQYHPQIRTAQPVPNLARLFPYRSACYKIGLIGLCASFALFLLGFFTPHWIIYSEEKRSWGLWNIDCDLDLCNTELLITRIFFALYFGSYLIAVITAVHENIKKVDCNTYHSRRLELGVIITGITGVVSMAMFSFVYGESVPVYFDWSMTIVVLSLLALFVSLAILMCANNKPVQGAGMILSLSNQQGQRQPAQQGVLIIQRPHQPMPSMANQMYPAQQSSFPMVNAYQAPQYPAQSQPLLPQPQPYPQPVIPDAPPPYSMAPPYPGHARAEFSYPTQTAQGLEFSKASAPPME